MIMNANSIAYNLSDFAALFIELYKEWFDVKNKGFWFDAKAEDDKYLANKYFIKIDNIPNIETLINQTVDVLIGAILALDQIPRHYKRVLNNDDFDCIKYSKLASEISITLMTELSKNIELYNSITANEWCFILLPFRHINDIQKMNTIVAFIIEKHNRYDTTLDEKHIYKKFLLHTLNQVHYLNTDNFIMKQKYVHKICNNVPNQWSKYANVLEHNPNEKITNISEEMHQMFIFNSFSENLKTINSIDANIIVSLSGGVDSCVCLYLLKQLLPEHTIIAVHINYNNKEECETELKFVRKYCAILNVKLYHRTITEIQRDDCHHQGLRDIYESITRDIRFDMYNKIKNIYSDKPSIVILGHNADDCFENIITNISNHKHYDNLSGMSLFSTIYDIQIFRPLLNIRKTEIIIFAIKMNIPFLKNSTPVWSNRGKIRDVILPALQNINKQIMQSFLDLSAYSEEIHHIILDYSKQILETNFIMSDEMIECSFKKVALPCHKILWTHILCSIFQTKKISYKSVVQFVEYLCRLKETKSNKNIKFILRKDIEVVGKIKNNDIKLRFMIKNECF